MFNIEVRRKSKKTIKAIIVSLNDHALRFNGDASVKLEKVIRDKDTEEPNLFSCFNEYVEKTFDQDQKLELFELYQKAHVIAESVTVKDYNIELTQLKPIVNAILDFINIRKFESFIEYSTQHMRVPPDLSAAASKGDYPEQTTITEYDYKEIVKFIFVTRTIYVIIFSLMDRFDRTMGPGYSEYVCGALIKDNPHIINMYGWNKLQTYINYAFNKRGIPQQPDAIGSMEYFVDKVLYNTVFSRLCCAVIPETEEGKNIATAINAAVRQHESSGGTFRKKDDRVEDGEDKRSLYERYQINEEIKAANEVMVAEYFSMGLFDENDHERHKDRFAVPCLGLQIKNVELVERVFDNMPPNWEISLDDHVIKLLQLTFAHAIQPMVYWSCDGIQLRAAIALGQVLLAEQGYVYLPSVLGATNDPNGMRSLSPLRLNSEDRDFLASICDIQSRNDEGRSFNEAVEAAEGFLDAFGNGQWKSNLEYGVLSEPDVYKRVDQGTLFSLDIEPEIKTEFMRLNRQVNA